MIVRIYEKKEIMVEKSAVQSVVFDKEKFDLEKAKNWLNRHDMKTEVDEKENTYRFRQKQPSQFKKFRTKKIQDGIKFVLGID